MFDSLKKKLSESVKRLAKKAEEEEKTPPLPPEVAEEAGQEEAEEEKGIIGRLKEKVTEKRLSEEDIEKFFSETETELLQADVALEVADYIKEIAKKELVGKPIKRTKAMEEIEGFFEHALRSILETPRIDIEKVIKENRPACIVFLGFNGSGKTTTIAKVAFYLKSRGFRPVLAAGDTFRAASIEQIEEHAKKLGVPLIKHKYGGDPAAVVFDARKHAEARGYDAVLADTAGRVHTDKNLMDELEKIVRVNKPHMKILVVDSLTGNDAVEQARMFNEKIGVDAVIMTKADVNKKGGNIFSVCYAIKKPVLFLGTGQNYGDLRPFDPEEFVSTLVS